jgi:hypothetical protein
METIILIVLGFVVGWKLSEWITTASFMRILDDLNVDTKDLEKLNKTYAKSLGEEVEEDLTVIQVKVEEHQGRLFAYESVKDTFLAHADNADDLLAKLIERFPPGTRITIDKDQGGILVQDAVNNLKTTS